MTVGVAMTARETEGRGGEPGPLILLMLLLFVIGWATLTVKGTVLGFLIQAVWLGLFGRETAVSVVRYRGRGRRYRRAA